jgi:hypothetical protein
MVRIRPQRRGTMLQSQTLVKWFDDSNKQSKDKNPNEKNERPPIIP